MTKLAPSPRVPNDERRTTNYDWNKDMRFWCVTIALLTSTLAAGCQTDTPAQSPDAPPTAEPVSEPNPVPLTTEPPSPEAPAEPPPPANNAMATRADTGFIFNRVMMKLASPERFSANETLIAFVEEKTGMKVATIGRAPLAVVLVTFEATTPPRDEKAQAKLTAVLSGLPEFVYAEPDRLRQPR